MEFLAFRPRKRLNWRLTRDFILTRFTTILLFVLTSFGSMTASADVQSQLDLFYGSDHKRPDRELQTLDVYWKPGQKNQPVIIYLHGGGWAFGDKSEINSKADFFVPNGFVFVSMNYRLRWDYTLFDQLQDVVDGIAYVKKNASKYGIDKKRVILMGHEAGAHLVSLVATDSRHLKAHNLSPSDIRAVVAIDSLSYDIPRVHKELGSFVERRQHRLVFSEDQQVQMEASPIYHIKKGESIPQFAVLYVSDNEASTLQAQAFAKALTKAEVNAIMIPGNTKTKQSIDVELGLPGDLSTGALMAFLRAST